MSADRIRPGSAARRRGASAKAPPSGSGDDTSATSGELAGPGDWVPGAEEVAGLVDVPVALSSPTPSPVVEDFGYAADSPPAGPQFGDEPLRPEEFVSGDAAEEMLGPDALERVPSRSGDEAGEPDDIEEAITTEDLERPPAPREGAWHRLYYGRTRFDFVRRRRTWFSFSLALILAGGISLATQGLNLGIDFVGGTAWTVQSSSLTINQARSVLGPLGFDGATITQLGRPPNQTLEVQAKLGGAKNAPAQSKAEVQKVADALARAAHVNFQAVGIDVVGPSWGSSVTTKAIQALIVFFILVSLYISIFFEWRMALAAVIAVAHDVLVVVGIYSLTRFEVTPDTVVAILTILGYSLYDTIVVFDRVRDNVKGIAGSGRITISDIVNLSMNQTLARSINTSLVAILPILAVLVIGADLLGAKTLQYFGWALLIGLLSGAYSSIFVASPIVAMLKERETRYRNIREKLAARGLDRQLFSAAALAAGALGGEVAGAGTASRRRRATSEAGAPSPVPGSKDGRIRPGSAPKGASVAASGAARSSTPGGTQRRPAARTKRKGRSR